VREPPVDLVARADALLRLEELDEIADVADEPEREVLAAPLTPVCLPLDLRVAPPDRERSLPHLGERCHAAPTTPRR
jgi:hypothetical protein